jgi:Transglutaminase-like superfamily
MSLFADFGILIGVVLTIAMAALIAHVSRRLWRVRVRLRKLYELEAQVGHLTGCIETTGTNFADLAALTSRQDNEVQAVAGQLGMLKAAVDAINDLSGSRVDALATQFVHLQSANAALQQQAQQTLIRRSLEISARLWSPHLSDVEIALLTDDELASLPVGAGTEPVRIDRQPRHPFDQWPPAVEGHQIYLDVTMQPVATDRALPPPELMIDDPETLYPQARILPPLTETTGPRAFYFEFDSSPSFDSPNLWRYPPLRTYSTTENCMLTAAQPVLTFATTTGAADGSATACRFPFRVTAMQVPADRHQLTYANLQRQAVRLGYGLSREEAIAQTFAYVQHTFQWAHDTAYRSPLDTFRTGLGGCGHINGLFALLAEMNGIRTRCVAGFDPIARHTLAGSGHTAVEVFDETLHHWRYVDPFFGFRSASSSARDLVQNPEAMAFRLGEFNPPGLPGIGVAVSLARVFRVRRYFDIANRRIATSMFALAGREDDYGRDWPLIEPPNAAEPSQSAADPSMLHVRARYIVSDGLLSAGIARQSTAAVASPWTVATIPLRVP